MKQPSQALASVPHVPNSNNESIGAHLPRYLLTATQRPRAPFIRHTERMDISKVHPSPPVQHTIPPLVHYGHDSLFFTTGLAFLITSLSVLYAWHLFFLSTTPEWHFPSLTHWRCSCIFRQTMDPTGCRFSILAPEELLISV
jgi:hypothetical protein